MLSIQMIYAIVRIVIGIAHYLIRFRETRGPRLSVLI